MASGKHASYECQKNKGVTYLTWPEFEKFRVLYTGSAPGLEESVRGFILL